MRLLAMFTGVFAILQTAWALCRNTALERWIIDYATVKPAVWMVQQLANAGSDAPAPKPSDNPSDFQT